MIVEMEDPYGHNVSLRAAPLRLSRKSLRPWENSHVPWCSTCDRFLSPPTVTAEGRCPTCGRPVEPGKAHKTGEEELPPVPLHMKVMGVALVIYLGYRFAQGVEWLIHRF
jgi:hypothetical protein